MVKVQIDINKPLKWWLRLKLDKTENVVVVGLKYERLPEFCYACGKIGHGIKERLDSEARNEALTGTITKFGSWMRASIPERLKNRNQSFTNGSSSEKGRSTEESRGLDIGNSINFQLGSQTAQKKEDAASSAAQRRTGEEKTPQTLSPNSGPSPKPMSPLRLEGPIDDKTLPTNTQSESAGPTKEMKEVVSSKKGDLLNHIPNGEIADPNLSQAIPSDMVISPQKKSNRKWKRSARESSSLQLQRNMSSPIKQVLLFGKGGKKENRGNKSPSPGPKLTGGISKGKSPGKKINALKKTPKKEEPSTSSPHG